MRSIRYIVIGILTTLASISFAGDKNQRKYCTQSDEQVPSLLGTMETVMQKRIEEQHRIDSYVQTFGCAFEEPDIEGNSIRAVYRAVVQSIRNRGVTFANDLTVLLQSTPPRPDNLTRDFVIYVHLPGSEAAEPARYEIKILELESLSTLESSKAVWTRVITRFAYREDYNKVPNPTLTESEFVGVMTDAWDVLQLIEKKKFKKAHKLLLMHRTDVASQVRPTVHGLVFGDALSLFDQRDPRKTYPAIFLGKGIMACELPKRGMSIIKFGEERLFGLRVDVNTFRRTTRQYADFEYSAPEAILQCLMLKFSDRKPWALPSGQ